MLTLPLFAKKILAQKGYKYTLKADIIIRDKKSDEVSFVTKYIDFAPLVKIGLNGQPYERLYDDGARNTKNTFTIDGDIAEGKKDIDALAYEVFYRSYNQELQQGIDGSPYYINGTEYKKITGGKISTASKFSIPTKFIDKPWSYLVRVSATDEKGTIIGEVHKQIEYYSFANDSDGLLGALPNNYTLTVSIPKKTYEENEDIPVDIAPYQKWARVIMTVERGNRIIDTIEQTLDGKPLTVKVKKWYAPNITINVMQIAGTELSSTTRKEPRFYVWFGQAEISTAMHTLNIALSTDKDTYEPGEKVTLTIKTTDSKNQPIDARVSLGVIDQALISLYDLIKEPIPYFFNKLGTNVSTYTNMKLLYQSLKAFANNGSKWGGGNGGSAMFSAIRNDLEDTAFRRGGIITTGGKAELTFNLPANVTTWVIDAIGISKDTRLGTMRKNIIAQKDLILEANAPAFVTLGDTIQVPVKVIASPRAFKEGRKVEWSARLTNNLWDTIEIGKYSIDANQKLMLPLAIPASRSQARNVTLTIQGEYGSAKDGIAQTIPLRRDGLVIKDSTSVIAKDGKHTFSIPTSLGSTVSIALSTFPTHIVDPVLQNTISSSNGSQQLMSSALAIAAADILLSKGSFVSTIMTGETIFTDEGIKNKAALINNNISRTLSYQQSDGSIGQRDNRDTKNSLEKYLFTTYIYGTLQTVRSQYASLNQLDGALSRIESYLRDYRTTSDSGFMRYLAQKTQAGKSLNKDELRALDSLKPLTITYGWLLRYAIAVYQKDATQSAEWKKYAVLPTNQESTSLGNYLNQPRWLLAKADALLADPAATQTERMDALSQLISSRDAQGTRGMDTVNAQALWTITRISPDTWTRKDPVSCTVIIDGVTQKVNVTKPGITLSQTVKKTKDIIAEFTCDNTLIADTSITYVPEKLTDLLGADKHVTQMNYSIVDPTLPIGETTQLAASWTTTLAAQNVVVHIYIPATYKFTNTIQSKNPAQPNRNGYEDYAGQALPFDLSDGQCTPTHREVRFDQLYLYYDTLPAITCDITVPLLKAYNGKTVIMPMTVSEMYKGNINGRKVVIQK
jgi:uncharacterized protein YfaS (alpha-2-macroglobulin family)